MMLSSLLFPGARASRPHLGARVSRPQLPVFQSAGACRCPVFERLASPSAVGHRRPAPAKGVPFAFFLVAFLAGFAAVGDAVARPSPKALTGGPQVPAAPKIPDKPPTLAPPQASAPPSAATAKPPANPLAGVSEGVVLLIAVIGEMTDAQDRFLAEMDAVHNAKGLAKSLAELEKAVTSFRSSLADLLKSRPNLGEVRNPPKDLASAVIKLRQGARNTVEILEDIPPDWVTPDTRSALLRLKKLGEEMSPATAPPPALQTAPQPRAQPPASPPS